MQQCLMQAQQQHQCQLILSPWLQNKQQQTLLLLLRLLLLTLPAASLQHMPPRLALLPMRWYHQQQKQAMAHPPQSRADSMLCLL
jgi:hypothetical protein